MIRGLAEFCVDDKMTDENQTGRLAVQRWCPIRIIFHLFVINNEDLSKVPRVRSMGKDMPQRF
jgi:hypothetical protein